MNNLRSTVVAKPLIANPAKVAAALQHANRKKVNHLFRDFDTVGPVERKRDLVFRICTKLDMLSQVEELDLSLAAQKERHGMAAVNDASRHLPAANDTPAPAAADAAGAMGGVGSASADDDAPDMFSIGSRVAGRMEQIMGALHA